MLMMLSAEKDGVPAVCRTGSPLTSLEMIRLVFSPVLLTMDGAEGFAVEEVAAVVTKAALAAPKPASVRVGEEAEAASRGAEVPVLLTRPPLMSGVLTP